MDANDKQENKQQPLYVILHLPKTGGTTFVFYLRRYLKKDECLFLYNWASAKFETKAGVIDFISTLSEEKKAKLKVIIGHEVYFGIHHYFSRPVVYLTFFREPAQRIISAFNFLVTRDQGLRQYFRRLTRQQILGRILVFYNDPAKRNEIFLFLKMRGFGETIESILAKFYFVGLTENLRAEQSFWFWQFGFKPKSILKINISRKFIGADIAPPILDKLRAINSLDSKLYEAALARYKIFLANHQEYLKISKQLNYSIRRNLVLYWPLVLLYLSSDWLSRHSSLYYKLLVKLHLTPS